MAKIQKTSPWAIKLEEKNNAEESKDVTEDTSSEETQEVLKQETVIEEKEVPQELPVIEKTQEKPEVKVNQKQTFSLVNKESLKMEVRELLAPYFENMKPGRPVESTVGGQMQFKLYSVIRSIIIKPSTQEEFNVKWNELLEVFRENIDTYFSDRYVFRFMYEWAGSDNDYKLFKNLIALCQGTCQHNNRSKFFKETNLNTLFETGLTEEHKQKLYNFYQI